MNGKLIKGGLKMLEAIKKRQAVRKYLSDKVGEQDIKELIDAFQASPCGMHQADVMQGIVVTDNDLLNEVENATKNACYNAPLLFLIVTKKDSEFGERDASVAAENIMIQATELGLGSVYVMGGALTLNGHPELLQKLGVDDAFEATAIVAVGKPQEQQTPEKRSSRYNVVRR